MARHYQGWRPRIVKLHRWLGLGAALFWLVQALTGVAIMFHWEIRDAAISSLHRPTDLAAIESRIDALAPAGSGRTVGAMWTSGGFPDRYDIFASNADGSSFSVRIAGDGTILRQKMDGDDGPIDILVGIHHNLLGGELGGWIVGISGLLLLSNLVAGLFVAWPRQGAWRTALRPLNKGPVAARFYAWHRALGLWLIVPALVIATTGTMMVFQNGLSRLIGVENPALPPNAVRSGPSIGLPAAVQTAVGAIPGSTLTAVTFPTAEDATYVIRLRAPGEIRRAYGASQVLVDANDGRVRGVYPIADAKPAQAFMNMLFPIHAGEIGGVAGRIAVALIGIWLVTMVILGLLLWQRRTFRRSK